MKIKKEKVSKKQKLVEMVFGGKIKSLVRSYRISVIAEVFNTLNESYYNEFGMAVEVDLLDFFDRVKNKLLTIDSLQEDTKEIESNKELKE